ncbi:MAG: hypothetical protein WCQ50_02165 [Spirochaetota bacterium]
MSGETRTVRLSGASLGGAKGQAFAAKLLALGNMDLVVDLRGVGLIEPAAMQALHAASSQRKTHGLATSFLLPEGTALEAPAQKAQAAVPNDTNPAAAPETKAAAGPASANTDLGRRPGSGVPTPRSVPIPKIPVQSDGASMTDIGTIIAAVMSRKWILGTVAVIAIGAGLAAATFLGKSTYEAECVLLYKPAENQISNDYEVLQNIDPTTTFVYRQSSQKDKSTVSTVQIKTLLNTIKIGANLEAVRAALDLRVPINTLGSAIDVRTQKDTDLLMIKATWDSAEMSAQIANTMVQIFTETNSKINRDTLETMRDQLEARFKDVTASYEKTAGDLAAFVAKNQIVALKNESEQYVLELIKMRGLKDEATSKRNSLRIQLKSLDSSMADLNIKIAKEKAEAGKKMDGAQIEGKIASINMRLDAVKARRNAMADLVTKSSEYDRIKQLYSEGLASKAELDLAEAGKAKAKAASQDDPELSSLLSEIENLRSLQTALPASSSQSERLVEELSLKRFEAQLELVSAEGNVQAYDASVTRIQSSIDGLPAVNKEYARLSTEAAGLEAEKKGLDRLVQQARTSLEKGTSDFTIIAKAPVPIFAASSNRKTLAIGAAFIVLALGWGSLILLELLDSRIRSGKEAAAALGLKVLATLPRADRKRLMPGGTEEPIHLENFRMLALKLRRILSRKGEKILIASVLPDSGKSVVAANLAFAWGRADERVLILDAETRSSAKVWPLDSLAADEKGLPLGLSDYLIYRADGLADIAATSVMPGVELIGRGTEEIYPDLLGSTRFAELLGQTFDVYDLILVEAPPILSAADAAMIAGLCNAIILVIRSRTVTPAKVSRALDEIGRERILGVIVTDIEAVFAKGDA